MMTSPCLLFLNTFFLIILSGFMFNYLKLNSLYSLNVFFNVDYSSTYLFILIMWVSLSCYLFMLNNNSENFKVIFLLSITGVTTFMLMTFYMSNLLFFFVFYELSLLPIFYMVWGWGGGVNKMKAGVFLVMYTSLMSAPLLLFLVMLNYNYKVFTWSMTLNFSNNIFIFNYMYMYMLLAFLVKSPMYFLHMWLPKAHVEASTTGSMILAGSLLKLGVYGLIRMNFMKLNKFYLTYFYFFIMTISVMGMFLSSVSMLLSTDGKIMIAFSSISHMNMLITSLLVSMVFMTDASLILSVTHGVISPALFLLFYYLYDKMKTRSMLLTRYAFMSSSLSVMLLSFLLLMSNAGCPPSFNFWGELMNYWNILTFNCFMAYIPLFLTSLLMITFSSYFFTRFTDCCDKNNKLLNFKNASVLNMSFLVLPVLLLWGFPN